LLLVLYFELGIWIFFICGLVTVWGANRLGDAICGFLIINLLAFMVEGLNMWMGDSTYALLFL
jgi:hypothetical protein